MASDGLNKSPPRPTYPDVKVTGQSFPNPLPDRRSSSPASSDLTLSDDQKKAVEKLKARDIEVRAHERAHAAAGGSLAGAPHYSFETGPDGQRYAVEGDVSISMPSSKDPATRLQEARQVKAAATAPARPSSQDQRVMAAAAQVETEALAELREEAALKMCQSCGGVHGLERIQVENEGFAKDPKAG